MDLIGKACGNSCFCVGCKSSQDPFLRMYSAYFRESFGVYTTYLLVAVFVSSQRDVQSSSLWLLIPGEEGLWRDAISYLGQGQSEPSWLWDGSLEQWGGSIQVLENMGSFLK